MENRIFRYGLALIMGLALISLTVQTDAQPSQGVAITSDVNKTLGDILEKIKAAVGEKTEKAIESAVQGITPIVEKAVTQIAEKTTQAATGQAQSFVDLTSTKVFDG
jgi:hypothetical protein